MTLNDSQEDLLLEKNIVASSPMDKCEAVPSP